MSVENSRCCSYSGHPTLKQISRQEEKLYNTINKFNKSTKMTYQYNLETDDIDKNLPKPVSKTTTEKINKGNKILKKLANTFTETFTYAVFNKKIYNVANEEQKRSRISQENVILNSSFSWETFQEFGSGTKTCNDSHENFVTENVATNATNIKNCNSLTKTTEAVQDSIDKAGRKIRDIIGEAIFRIKDKAQREVDVSAEDMAYTNLTLLEDVQKQCQYTTEILGSRIIHILSINNEKTLSRNAYFIKVIGVLKQEVEDYKNYSKYLETKYARLLKAEEMKETDDIDKNLLKPVSKTTEKINKGNKIMKKLANTFTKTFTYDVFNKKIYNVANEEQKSSRVLHENVILNSSFSWETLLELGSVTKTGNDSHENFVTENIEPNATNIKNCNSLTNSTEAVQDAINKARRKIRDIIGEAIFRIKDKAQREVDVSAEDMVYTNLTLLEDVQKQCQYTTEILGSRIIDILSINSENTLSRNAYFINVIGVLKQEVQVSKNYSKYLETRYARLLEAEEMKIAQQSVLVESLQQGIGMTEINNSRVDVL